MLNTSLIKNALRPTTWVLALSVASISAFASAKELASSTDYSPIPQSELVYMATDAGQLVIRVTDIQSPVAAEQFIDLVNEGFYNGLDVYRVVDGFVIQAGEQEYNPETSKKSEHRTILKAEFTRPIQRDAKHPFEPVQAPALLAPETGFIDGFAAGRDVTTNEEWLLHCPGIVAMARDNDPDTGSTEFYAVIGHAPRHLDRNMSVFGRVIDGMNIAQSMHRGPASTNGVIDAKAPRTKILSMTVGTQLPATQQIQYQIENTKGNKFNDRLKNARHNPGPFLVYPGTGNVDVCYHQPRVIRQ